ncbi:SGNH/GDSL hydrolase family protein [Amycolatopsis sp. NPDC101161]|uniref:SGNH/GDSL hydrolase family protein n=1 Tax=Amycolatopsis sp. NPDC101161 TaxID=3363940 RepID=UPI00381AE70A
MPVMLALAGLIASAVTFVSSGTASAAESIPELQWPAIKSSRYVWDTVTSPSGVTNGCDYSNNVYSNLKSLNSSGQVVRELDPNQLVDGVPNCIYHPAVAGNGDLYGRPYGKNASGSYVYASLLAYTGNTLKWKYDVGCTSQGGAPVVGADGNVYAISNTNGTRLIGLTPEVEPGTTQPKKVLDVALTGSGLCSAELYAVKDGIAYINNGQAYLYAYGGKKLGTSPSGAYLTRAKQISADGRLFYPIFTGSGSTASIKLVAYNLFRDAADWTAPESLFGYNPQYNSAYPTPDGGVVVQITRLKVVGGAPTTERVRAIVRLNALGQKSWEQEFSNQDASGNPWNNTYVSVDVSGKIAVLREGSLQTNDPSNNTMPAISIGVFDGAGTVVYDQIMRGNLDKQAGGVNGYNVGGQGTNGPTTGPNTLYFLAVCKGACGEYLETKLYAVKIPGLGLDYPRGAVITRTPRPATAYVALGDSFSSGEGVPPFEAATDLPGVNTCHRSTTAYARLIAGTSSKIPSLGSDGFRACSGAVTSNITDTVQWNEGTQLDLWPDSTTQVVTLTIGGNDIGFADFAKACVLSTCQSGSSAYNSAIGKINNDLPSALATTYQKILAEFPNANIYVMDYPQVIANKQPSDAFDSRCAYMYNSGTNGTGSPYYPWEDAWAARDIVTKLDAKISTAIGSINNARLHYVPVNAAGSPFVGHGICDTGTSYFQNLDQVLHNEAYVFHPNSAGQQAYANVMSAKINAG